MDMLQDSLLSLKDDMVAFIAGHGMRRVPVYVGEEVPTVVWEDDSNPDSWKDFVETAKAAGAAFLTMSEVVLEKEDLELLLEELQETNFPDEESPLIDEAQSLATHVGRVGISSWALPTRASCFCTRTRRRGISGISSCWSRWRVSATSCWTTRTPTNNREHV